MFSLLLTQCISFLKNWSPLLCFSCQYTVWFLPSWLQLKNLLYWVFSYKHSMCKRMLSQISFYYYILLLTYIFWKFIGVGFAIHKCLWIGKFLLVVLRAKLNSRTKTHRANICEFQIFYTYWLFSQRAFLWWI